jgi:primary-amine oxidase
MRATGLVFACVCGLVASSTSLARANAHPLEPLSKNEIESALSIVVAHFKADEALPDEKLRYSMVVLLEPPKSLVLAWSPGKPFPRLATVQILHYPSNRFWVADVDLKAKRVLHLAAKPLGTQPAVTSEEFSAAEEIVKSYEPFVRAMRARGLNPSFVYVDVWAPGDAELPAAIASKLENGPKSRLVRCVLFYRGGTVEAQRAKHPQNPYDRPIEGVVLTVDMNTRQVIEMTDTVTRPVIAETGNAVTSRKLKPLLVQQPKASDIAIEGRLVRWHRWKFYAVLHPREGLVLYDVRFQDHGVWRPIAYRMALSEIYVPYGLGDSNWVWRSAFDVGEYNAGTLAQALEANRDVPENAKLIDATFFSDVGPTADNPSGTVEFPATLALYERDAGLLWTRTDPTNFKRDTRYARELVVTWNCWIGNYIYAFDWIFKLDGSIEVKVHLTGTTLNRGTDAQLEASAPKVAVDAKGALVSAPNHQHFLSFRLDLDVDGPNNTLMEMEAANLPNTGFKNSFGAVMRGILNEGYRDVNPLAIRHWHVESATTKNPFGKPTSYALEPTAFAVPYSAPDFPGLKRAEFARHAFWFTRYKEGELYAAGDYPNQGEKPDGVGVYTSPAEPISGDDMVLWFTTGFTHLAKPEDYPVMPTESIGFKLQPRGFFDQNPALEISDQAED